MKFGHGVLSGFVERRSSHEERGLKFNPPAALDCDDAGRSSHEERGLKSPVRTMFGKSLRRSSHEERGLKSI